MEAVKFVGSYTVQLYDIVIKNLGSCKLFVNVVNYVDYNLLEISLMLNQSFKTHFVTQFFIDDASEENVKMEIEKLVNNGYFNSCFLHAVDVEGEELSDMDSSGDNIE